ncbi:hypothetical protein BDW60DRAFT_188850 [Aspergillus nidulans var. acristatus]
MRLTSALLAVLPCAFFASASQESYVGCFSTPGSFENLGTYTFQSIGHCLNQCTEAGYNMGDYAALKETDCYCGDVDPAKDDLVDDDQCTAQCPGYAPDACGGSKAWSIYAIGEVRSDLWSNGTTSSTTNVSKGETTAASSATSTPTGTATFTSTVEHESISGTVSASSSSPASVSSTSASASTSIEPTPTGNSASRRYSFFFFF